MVKGFLPFDCISSTLFEINFLLADALMAWVGKTYKCKVKVKHVGCFKRCTILPKRGFAACEHHNDARTCARTDALAVGKCYRQVDKKSSDEKNKKKCFAIRILAANSKGLTQLPIQNVKAKVVADCKSSNCLT